MVPGHQHELVAQRGRAAFTKAASHRHVAKVAAPHKLPVHRVAEQAPRPKRGVDMLSIGAGRGRSKRVGLVRALVRHGLDGRLLPPLPSTGSIKAQHAERPGAAVVQRHAGRHKHAVVPDHGRRRAAARNLHLPAKILFGAKLHRRCGRRCLARSQWPSPVGPAIACDLSRRIAGHNGQHHREHSPSHRASHGASPLLEEVLSKDFRPCQPAAVIRGMIPQQRHRMENRSRSRAKRSPGGLAAGPRLCWAAV